MMQAFEVHVISLPHALQRRERMEKLLAQHFDWQFFEAIAGSSLSLDMDFYNQQQRLKIFGYDMQRNELACFLSHRELWKTCAQQNKNFLILEDDVQFTQDSGAENVTQLMHQLGNRMGQHFFVRLGNSHIRTARKNIQPIHKNFILTRYHRDPLGAFAYSLTPAIAQKLVENSARIFTPVDDYMWRGWENNCILYDIAPDAFFTQEEGNPSTIGERKKPAISIRKKIKREWYRFLDNSQKMQFEKNALKEKLPPLC